MKEGLHGPRGHSQFSWPLSSFTALTLLFCGLMEKNNDKMYQIEKIIELLVPRAFIENLVEVTLATLASSVHPVRCYRHCTRGFGVLLPSFSADPLQLTEGPSGNKHF